MRRVSRGFRRRLPRALAALALAAGLVQTRAARAGPAALAVCDPDPEVRFSDGRVSLLVSQIGYALPGVRTAFLTAPSRADGDAIGRFDVIDTQDGGWVLSGTPRYAGEWVGGHFWSLDLSAIDRPGEYRIVAGPLASNRFPVRAPAAQYLAPFVWSMAIEQMRLRYAPDRLLGFVDCGNDIRETNSHATMLRGILDVLELVPDAFTPGETARAEEHAGHLVDFLESLQRPDGEVLPGWASGGGTPITEGRWPNHTRGVYGYLRFARHVRASDPARARRLLARAGKGLARIRAELRPEKAHAAVLAVWLLDEALAHAETGSAETLAEARLLARELRARQVPPGRPTREGLWGLFHETSRSGRLARLNHHQGGDLEGEYWGTPLGGLVLLMERYPRDPERGAWEATVRDWAEGFLRAGAERSPLGLVANGEYDGVRWFSDLYHGMSVTYGLVAADLALYAGALGDPALLDVAERQLLWVGGLNTGRGFPHATAPFSCIARQGYQWLEDGHGIFAGTEGAVVNGLSATPAFEARMPDGVESPRYLSDESWIASSGAWLAGAAALVRARERESETARGAAESGSAPRP